jgi:endonuclease V-like protein UPF0215 family
MLQAVILGGITIAGLGIIDVTTLDERLGLAVVVVTRHGARSHCEAPKRRSNPAAT